MQKNIRKPGINILEDVPWGTHFCQFYQTKEDLIDILVHYFKTGLENNEFCMWITSEPLSAEDAKISLKKVVKDLNNYIRKGQLEILDCNQWYIRCDKFDADKTIERWIEKEKYALKSGFDGLRLSGNTYWLKKKDWNNFTHYEEQVNHIIGERKMLAICTYSLEKCGALEIIDVIKNHQFALIKREGKWEIIKSQKHSMVEYALQEEKEKFRVFSENVPGVVCIYDFYPDGYREPIYIGPGLEELVGKATAKKIGNSVDKFFSLIHPEDLVKLQAAAEEVEKSGQILDHEYRLHIEPDNYIWIRSISQMKQMEKGIARWCGIVFNITESKASKDTLKQSEERYRELFDNMSSGVAVYQAKDSGKDFIFKSFNRAGERIENTKKERLIGKTLREVFSEIENFPIFNVFSRVWKTGKAERVSSEVHKNQRTVGWRENYIYRLPTGEIVSIFDDITKRRKAEEALRESAETAMEFVDFPPEKDIFDFICQKVKGFCDETIVGVNSIHEEENTLTIRQIMGIEHNKLKLIEKLLGKKVINLSLPDLEQEAKTQLSTGKLIKVEGGLYRILFKKVPQAICQQIEKLVGLKEIYSIGLRRKGKLFGNVTILSLKDTELNKDNIEAFVNQASIVLERRQVEENLRDSERRFRIAVENNPDFIVFVKRDGTIYDVNRLTKGFTKDMVIGQSIFNRSWYETKDQVKAVRKQIDHVIRTGKPGSYEYSQIAPDGSLSFYETLVAPFEQDSKGSVVSLQCATREITERKKADELLKESEEKYRQLVSTTTDAIMLFDAETKQFIEVNNSCEELYGYSRDEFLKLKQRDITAEPEKSDESIRALFKGKTARIPLRYHRKKNGSVFPVEISGNTFELEGRKVACGVIRDITERKKAEKMIQESEEKYHSLFEQAADPIVLINPKSAELVEYNEKAFQNLGYTKEELSKLKISDLDVIESSQDVKKHVEKVISEGADNFETKIRTKTGEIRDFQVNAKTISFGEEDFIQSIWYDITARKKATELLRESEEKYRTLSENLPGIVYRILITENNRMLFFNDMLKKMSGYEEEELITGQVCSIDPLITPEDHKQVVSTVKNAIRNKESFEVEYRVKYKNGNIKNWHERGKPIYDSKGKPVMIDGVILDITDRKKAEEALKESEEKYRTLIENQGEGFAVVDTKERFTFANPAAENLFGVPPGGLIGKNVKEFMSPEQFEVVQKQTRKRQKGEKSSYEVEIIRQNKEKRNILVTGTPQFDKNKKVIGSFGIFRDITERKKAEEALQKSYSEISSLFDGLPIGIAYYTSDLRVNRMNKAMEKIAGTTQEEITEKFCYEVVGEYAQDHTKQGREKICSYCRAIDAINEGTVQEHEMIGRERAIHIIDYPTKDHNGNVFGVMEIAEDITQRKKLQQQLIQTEKLAAVGTLAYGIAHEFNNLLAGILTNAELGLITTEPQQIRDSFQTIADNSHRASSITHNLLAFARQKETQKELIDITEPLKSVLAITHRELEKLNIEIVEEFKPVPKVYCDAGQLSEVFLNMITNARDAMKPRGGKLTIQLDAIEDSIHIIFQDTGHGIRDDIKEKIFEPFVTTKGALGKSEIPGTGLGLFLSYGIIDGYKGKIEVKSEPGRGTVFTILIPISDNLPQQPIPHKKSESPTETDRRLNILLVDDEKAITEGLKKFLESKGHQVTSSLKASQGLKLFKKDKFDLVLSDILMPDMDGIELIRKIREKNKNSKILVMTGYLLKEKAEEAREAGAEEVLIKPFKNEILYEVISKLFLNK